MPASAGVLTCVPHVVDEAAQIDHARYANVRYPPARGVLFPGLRSEAGQVTERPAGLEREQRPDRYSCGAGGFMTEPPDAQCRREAPMLIDLLGHLMLVAALAVIGLALLFVY
jgi:hypothetical protein